MFDGLSFTVVPYSIDIGIKRKKILEDIIAIPLSNFNLQKK